MNEQKVTATLGECSMGKTRRGLNQGNIQNLNRTLLINLLRQERGCSRATLAALSGLQQATITYIINDFQEWGLVRETGFMTGIKGRRSIGLSINTDQFAVVGIRISRKNFSVGLFNLMGEAILVRHKRVDPAESAREIFDSILDHTRIMIDRNRSYRVVAIGVATPGPYNSVSGRIALMSGAPEWSGVNIAAELTEQFGIPAYVEHDANAAVIAQYWHNHLDDPDGKVIVYVTAGQGVGAGILVNGELIRGSLGMAGEIGHTSVNIHGPRCVCGNYGCLENYCSSLAFTRMVSEKLGRETSFEDAVVLVRKGQEDVLQVFWECCDALSVGIVNLINSFNPDYVIIGDEMSHVSPEQMRTRIIENVRERLLPEVFDHTKIMMSIIEHDSMVHGAAVVAIREAFADTERFFGNRGQ